MKKRVIGIILTISVIATLTACGGAATTVSTEPSQTVDETTVETEPETTEVEPKSEEVTEEPAVEEATPIEEPEREVKTWDYEGTTILSYDPENEYVAKIRAAIPNCDSYQGAFVAKMGDDTWTFYFEPEDEDTTEYFNAGNPGDEPALSDDEINKYFEATDTMIANYTKDGDNNTLPKVDLDGDGKVTENEAMITAIFVDNGRSGIYLSGHHVFAPTPNSKPSIVWDDLADTAEEATVATTEQQQVINSLLAYLKNPVQDPVTLSRSFYVNTSFSPVSAEFESAIVSALKNAGYTLNTTEKVVNGVSAWTGSVYSVSSYNITGNGLTVPSSISLYESPASNEVSCNVYVK